MTINKNTKVALGTVLLVGGMAVGGVWNAHDYWSREFESLSDRLEKNATDSKQNMRDLRGEVRELTHTMDRRLERIEERSADRWSLTDMRLWVERFRQRNPSLDIPEPEPVRFPNPR